MNHGRLFFETYVRGPVQIVDIGSQDVNGSLRSLAPQGSDYTGVDFAEGKGVDVILSDPYRYPFADNSFDVCVSSSCLEHAEFFWLSFLEMLRIVKPTGLVYLNTPCNGPFHRYPVDCWRFYPDSGMALRNWARFNGHNTELLEPFTGSRGSLGMWNDFIAVFVKDEGHKELYPDRMAPKTSTRDGPELGLGERARIKAMRLAGIGPV